MGIDLGKTQFVDKFYQMDPKFERILWDGTELYNGMVVLPEDYKNRADVSAPMNPYELEHAMRHNRWCEISRVEVDGVTFETTFLAKYSDDSMKKITVPTSWSWLVAIESVPQLVVSREMTNRLDGSLPNADDVSLEDPDKAVGTAQVPFGPKSWATPPFGGGDGDLDTPMPRREPGAVFQELKKEYDRAGLLRTPNENSPDTNQ